MSGQMARVLPGTYGWFAIKDDSKFLYVLVDYAADVTPAAGDFAWVLWDQKNDGGTKPKSDDYDLILRYSDKNNYASSIAQGTGTGWGASEAVSSLGILGASSTNTTEDAYSKKSHLTYEFQVPRSILDNSTVVTSIGFSAGALDGSSGNWISLPRSGDYRVPDSWAQLTFSLPIPEFPSILLIMAASMVAVGFLSRRKARQMHVK